MAEPISGMGGVVNVGGVLVKCRRWSANIGAAIEDVTVFESNGFVEIKALNKSFAGEFETIAFPGAIHGSTGLASLITSGETGSRTLAGSVTITNVSVAPSAQGSAQVVAWTCQFASTGSFSLS